MISSPIRHANLKERSEPNPSKLQNSCKCSQVTAPVSLPAGVYKVRNFPTASSHLTAGALSRGMESLYGNLRLGTISPNSSFSSCPSPSLSTSSSLSPPPAPYLYFSIENILRPDFPLPCPSPLPLDLSPSSLPPSPPSSPSPPPPGMLRGPTGAILPAWIFATRYSDRPSSGRARKGAKKSTSTSCSGVESKKARTSFSQDQLARLRDEFEANQYLTETRREALATELNLGEDQLRVWFQNRRAQMKRSVGGRGPLAKMLSQQGLYNH